MAVHILGALVVCLFARGICTSHVKAKRTRKKIEAMTHETGFSVVSTDSVQELKNIINFLLERENDLGVLNHYRLYNHDRIFGCDLEFFKKKNHPKLLAFIRAAHLAGFTVSVRRRDRADNEKKANSDTCMFEYVTEIHKDTVDYKRKEEIERKKHKYGYYK